MAACLSAVLLAAACADAGGTDEVADGDADTGGAAGPVEPQDVPGAEGEDGDPLAAAGLPDVGDLTVGSAYEDFGEDGLDRWQDEVPDIEDLTVTSTADGSEQPTLYLPPSGDDEQPLLVVVHSWSTGYTQHLGLPYARWADEAGWAFTHPDFRGVNDGPESTGSDLAVQDVADAITDAIDRGGVDADRVYVTGFSGGGMMALLAASRFPDLVDGVVSWVPVEDLNDWYAYNADEQPEEAYAGQIEAGIPTYLGHGVADGIVPPSHGVRAFDALADEGDRLGEDVEAALADGEVPAELDGDIAGRTYFTDDDPQVRHARTSAATTLVLFDGEHDLVFGPTLRFLAALDADR